MYGKHPSLTCCMVCWRASFQYVQTLIQSQLCILGLPDPGVEAEMSVPCCRQRMVYKAIWLELQDTVHAVDAMVTKTPAEVAS